MKNKCIAITGTHGTGKTTLSYSLGAYYKQQGCNVKIVQEVARTCPFPINNKMTTEAAKWIYLEHTRKEIEARAKHNLVIGDRSIFDSFAYAQYFNLSDSILLQWKKTAIKMLHDYDQIIFVRPDIPIQADGTRSIDLEFQEGIDKILSDVMQNFKHTEINSSQIFNEKETWKSCCL